MPVLRRCKVASVSLLIPMLLAFGQPPNRVMPATINFDQRDSVVRGASIDAALALSLELTGNYAYIPMARRDSVLNKLNEGQKTINSAAKALGATHVAFVTVHRIVNLIRAEIVFATGSDYSSRFSGIGYSNIHFKNENNHKLVAEPAILSALQRAIAMALENNDLYAGADSTVRVYPTELLSVGGIDYQQQPSELPMWQLFKERTVSSYDLAQNVVKELNDNQKFTILDVDTRDTMFATAGFHLIANDRPVTSTEIQILRLFEVSHLLIGSLERTQNGAKLTLMLCRINNNDTYTSLQSANADINEDTKGAFHAAIKECLKGLGI